MAVAEPALTRLEVLGVLVAHPADAEPSTELSQRGGQTIEILVRGAGEAVEVDRRGLDCVGWDVAIPGA